VDGQISIVAQISKIPEPQFRRNVPSPRAQNLRRISSPSSLLLIQAKSQTLALQTRQRHPETTLLRPIQHDLKLPTAKRLLES